LQINELLFGNERITAFQPFTFCQSHNWRIPQKEFGRVVDKGGCEDIRAAEEKFDHMVASLHIGFG
jgi:hypothetical protein